MVSCGKCGTGSFTLEETLLKLWEKRISFVPFHPQALMQTNIKYQAKDLADESKNGYQNKR
jgi:hypothetical protein